MNKFKKYSDVSRLLVPLFLSLLTLSGCDVTSAPKERFSATGSWEGTVAGNPVRGIVTPAGTYHLAILDDQGNFLPERREYIGSDIAIDADNIGSMTVNLLETNNLIMWPSGADFILSSDRLLSQAGSNSIDLRRTSDAAGPARQSDVAGHWSMSGGNITDVVVNADGSFKGHTGINCLYSGIFQLGTPAWNIYTLTGPPDAVTGAPGMKISTVQNQQLCPDYGDFNGLAMVLAEEGAARRLWFVSNDLKGMRLFSGNWSETVNVAPLPAMTVLGERADQSVLVQEGLAVELDAQGSSDENVDPLTYEWSVVDPTGLPLTVSGTGSSVTFIPDQAIDYTLNLSVSDGIVATPLSRSLRVEWTPNRYVDQGNGTVLDTRTNLVWLKDAGCLEINLVTKVDNGTVYTLWGDSALGATNTVTTKLKDGVCGLTDGSASGEWALPTTQEFRQIATNNQFPAGPPALANGKGDGQWSEGDVFAHVGVRSHANPNFKPFYGYWTSNSAIDQNWYVVNLEYSAAEPDYWLAPFGIFNGSSGYSAWPVWIPSRPGK